MMTELSCVGGGEDHVNVGMATILGTLRRLHSEGLACLMVEQDAHVTLETTSRSYVFRTGQIITEGTSSELRKTGLDLVEEIYLGSGGTSS